MSVERTPAEMPGQDIEEQLRAALRDIIAANKDFRQGMPTDWEGDPLQDAIDRAAGLLAALPAREAGAEKESQAAVSDKVHWRYGEHEPSRGPRR